MKAGCPWPSSVQHTSPNDRLFFLLPGHALLPGIPYGGEAGLEDRSLLQTLRRAAVQPASLRLWPACAEERAGQRGQREARSHPAAEGGADGAREARQRGHHLREAS